MKKILLMFMLFPILNSCQNENSKYVGLWQIEDDFVYFASDGSVCMDVRLNLDHETINELENCSCDETEDMGTWMKVNDQNFLQLSVNGRSMNMMILNVTPDLLELGMGGRDQTLEFKRVSESELIDE
jgi:hypothetical protein